MGRTPTTASRLWSTQCRRTRWPRRCTGILVEDEYSYVLEGNIGALLGDSVVIGNPGDLIFKPRNQWHTFWNAGDKPARVLEIISPAGFENYLHQLVHLGGGATAGTQALGEL